MEGELKDGEVTGLTADQVRNALERMGMKCQSGSALERTDMECWSGQEHGALS